ncbi:MULTISPECIES: beta-ketoacyl-[acyl-carrier-protein] synthase family protein [Streptomyces]|uniref:Beta-ketoacyl-[acyl-carrier-protein] synthase family protein n=1 Tax=Streptomyces thermoviolaceus subsp. thermoviolaceus TaxID=66860 RepID=A0ABX0YTN1_STRTL|nr:MULTISPECIES: beta-ketoacyl-[acyl-carrier-protein] synthase family protein [Streptomyces]MCM3264885.1 beta-ketoacyl-[acyl-carrier-protein] synthase family protein [Streptomyces thermoviolaceus]NJP15453.1 beta-ketoacyl-[acyl-carrier-protein] synthase family protein [Streptomyces thermoviolaceus subsp. thermoviolaceus]RSS06948.1 beta-ketoacyl-[acyl-carrier-protein] synthase family protein [Streptomyces sp. WAC00469]WTD48690.1 beta-ketoacyl-[acyl-carrier-protein] synthase family protein [Strept
MTRRVAVTGIGVVAPGGIGADAFWDLLANGRTATRGITFFDPAGLRSRIAAECDFDPRAAGLSEEQIARCDRYIQFALVAGEEAVRDAGLDMTRVDPWRVAVSLGTAVGGTTRLESDYVLVSHHGERWEVDHERARPHLERAFTPSTLASTVAERFGARGPVQTVSTGCTSGLDAVGYALYTVQEGRADICIAGASDSPISPITMACFDAIKATSPNNDDPEHASRPFDNDRDGFVMGEGGAVLVLEELEHARARGAHVYCELSGYATFGNAYHMTGLTSEGVEMAKAIEQALDHARLDGSAIDYVNAHGSGTRQNDRHETAAVKRALGHHAYETPMSSIKSMVGHSLGAIGAIEVVACVLAMAHQVVPPTANYETPDPECDLDYVPRVARERRLDAVLSVGSGFGGFQSAVILTRPRERSS